ncbi:hypothetical protein MLD38_029444 [Melastoma candidum]|uniref:Uncharacterized protein n=1 Tax=Melastoma candidum TaxID=119954 RepID=A0ACB9N3T3_9MYRT|nr:hypothetical protein MLD38_029444 [Melastoma candidum]
MPISINTTTKKKKKIQKSLQDYISKIKKPQTPQLPPHSSIFSPCNHPKTPSFGRTPVDVDRFLSGNFKSLYVKDEEECCQFGDVVLFDSPRLIYPPLNLRASKRFFFPPGSSGRSLMEEARSSLATSSSEDFGSSSTSSTTTNTVATTPTTVTAAMDQSPVRESPRTGKDKLPDDCVAVVMRTRCPYGEFKRSMQEVVESRADGKFDGEVDWEFMEEMLMCYLNLNERKSHKHVLSAFVDVIVALRHHRDPGNTVTSKSRDVRSNKKKDNI